MQIMILGLGRLGQDLLTYFESLGHHVQGTTTKDWQLGETLPDKYESFLERADFVVETIPPVEGLLDRLHDLISKTPSLQKRPFYVCNSISLYGKNQGEVDESTPPSPETDRGRELLKLEDSLTENFKNVVSLRLGGLFSDSRHPVHYLAGRKDLSGKGEFLNGVHHLDIARALLHLFENKIQHQRVNIVWDQYPEKSQFYNKAAEKLNLSRPEYKNESNPNKKIIHSKVLLDSGFTFQHPLDQ